MCWTTIAAVAHLRLKHGSLAHKFRAGEHDKKQVERSVQITQVRNATLLLEFGGHRLLVDPMMSSPSVLPGFKLFGGGRQKNPLTALPPDAEDLMSGATAVLVTHEHPDHLDQPALEWIKVRGLKVWASATDAPNLGQKGLDVISLPDPSLDVEVEVVPGRHGHGLIGWLMGPVSGFYFMHANEPTLYLSSDTVLTATVEDTIERLQPDVIVAPGGTANFGMGKDLMFSGDELIRLSALAPGKVVFNHMESIDHCPMTKDQLQRMLEAARCSDSVLIPADGETLVFEQSSESARVPPGPSPPGAPGFQKWLTAKFAGT